MGKVAYNFAWHVGERGDVVGHGDRKLIGWLPDLNRDLKDINMDAPGEYLLQRMARDAP